MILADLGADVIRVARIGEQDDRNLLQRGRRSVAIDLKHPDGLRAARRLIERSDLLIEGFRPGVTERLGVGPDDCLALNPRLIYGRVTGWGQEGPNAHVAGHDINYIALAGALYTFGYADRPPRPPTNIVGDFAGGGMLLVIGMLGALWESRESDQGQVVDAAMVDGVALTMISIFSAMAAGDWDDRRGSNVGQGAPPYYAAYETADGGYVSLGSIEPGFFDELCTRLELDQREWADRDNRARWPALQQKMSELFKTRTRDEWCRVLEGTDACFAPVLTPREAPEHPHNAARDTFLEIGGVLQPGPAPRFSRTPGAIRSTPPAPGEHTAEVLAQCGLADDEIEALVRSRAVGQAATAPAGKRMA